MSTIALSTNDFYVLSKILINACVPPHCRRKHKTTLEHLTDAFNTGRDIPDVQLADVIADLRRIAKCSDIKEVLNFVSEQSKKENSERYHLMCENLKQILQFHIWFSRTTNIIGTKYLNGYIIISFDDSIDKVMYCLNNAEQKLVEELKQSPPS